MFPSPAASAAAAAAAASTGPGIGSASSYNAMSHESGAGGGAGAPGSAHAGLMAADTLFVPNRNSSAMLAHYSVPASAASPISTSSTPPASAASNHTVSQYLQKRHSRPENLKKSRQINL